MKEKSDNVQEERQKQREQNLKKFRQKTRYAKQLNRKTGRGQLRMSGQIDHYLNKL